MVCATDAYRFRRIDSKIVMELQAGSSNLIFTYLHVASRDSHLTAHGNSQLPSGELEPADAANEELAQSNTPIRLARVRTLPR